MKKKCGGKVKAKKAFNGLYEETPLKRIDPYNPTSIASNELKAPAAKIDPTKLQNPLQTPNRPKIGNMKGYSGPSFGVGDALQGGISLINMLLPQEQGRKHIDNSLAYNPYPQGTGSQAIFKDGGEPVPKKKKAPTSEQIAAFSDYAGMDTKVMISKLLKKGLVGNQFNEVQGAYTDQLKSLSSWVPSATTEILKSARAKGIRTPNEFKLNKEYLSNNMYKDALNHPIFNQNFPNYWDTIVALSEEQYAKEQPQTNVAIKKNGGKIKYKQGGLQTHEGGNVELTSYNPMDGGTGEFKGASHKDGGIQSSFEGKPFEAEGGEPYRIDENGALEIFGNLTNPLTGNKFKKDVKTISRQEQKAQKFVDKGSDIVTSTDTKDKWDKLKFNTGTVLLKGGLSRQKELAEAKDQISAIQQVMLDQKGDTMEQGGKIYADGGKSDPKPWEWRGTKKDKLDKKIKDFISLVEKKGLEGYSGSKSGYDVRNTKSKRPSRHGSNQALDMMFKDKDAYDKILKDPELSSYLYDNGLTAINEYDPSIAKKTGATAGHLHIGFDKGTPTSDKFRQDYKSTYGAKNKPTLVNPPSTKPFMGQTGYLVPVGDAQTEDRTPWNPNTSFTPRTPNPVTPVPPTPAPEFNFKNPETKPFQAQRRRKPWEQIAPAIPQLFDKADFVERQSYQPDLYTPYQVSFQDRINQNSRNFNALAPSLVGNPEAQGALAAQLYGANNAVQADEFRTNQGITNDITNKNVSILNDAKLKNLQLADTQYVRQTQAQGNTRDRRIGAGIQIGDVLAKNNLENKTLDVTSQLYKDYAYDKNMQLQYIGDNTAGDQISEANSYSSYPTKTEVTNIQGNTRTKQTYEKPNWQLDKADILKGLRKKRFGDFKDGGKLTHSKIRSLMN